MPLVLPEQWGPGDFQAKPPVAALQLQHDMDFQFQNLMFSLNHQTLPT